VINKDVIRKKGNIRLVLESTDLTNYLENKREISF